VPRRPRPPKAVAAQRDAIDPPEAREARRAQRQAFVDGTWLRGVVSFERRVAQFRQQEFAAGMTREAAAEAVRECDRRWALETAEAGASARDTAVRSIKEAQARALTAHLSATRVVFVRRVARGAKGARQETVTREEVPDNHARLRALELYKDLHLSLCRLLGVDEPIRVLDETPRGFDENLVRAAQETSDADFEGLLAESPPTKTTGGNGKGTVH